MNNARISATISTLLLACLVACGGGATSAPEPTATAATGGDEATAGATATATPEKLEAPEFRLPDTAAPTAYAATLELDPSAETFAGEIEIQLELSDATQILWLNGKDLTVREASFGTNGQSLAATVVDHDGEELIALRAPEPIGPGASSVTIAYEGKVSDTELSGVFRQKEVDDWYMFTQFEAIDARRAFPCFDEPQHKVPWQLTIKVKPGLRAFANTPEIKKTTEGEWEIHEFAPSKPIPSYLVAFAAGPFETVDAGKAGRNETPLRIIVPKGRTADAAYAVEATGQILTLLENYFDVPYPYAKLDSIVVPNFFGAMENPGLITYQMQSILHDPKTETPSFHRRYAGIAAHEIAHQWFGNLVTMKWWDDLWLNESFATWMAAKVVNQWKPEWGGEVYFVGQRERAMGSDALPTAKQIRQPVEQRADLFSGGSAIIYAKGSSVLTNFEKWIGEDEFREGIRGYMKKHAFGNATAEDFLAALSGQSSDELAGAFKTFIDQPGYPLVTAELTCDKGATPALKLSQERYVPTGAQVSGEQLWQIPVCARYAGGRDCTLMKQKTATLELSKAKRCPKWVVANDNAAGYYRVNYEGDLLHATLLGPGAKKLTLNERIMFLGDVTALVDVGKMSPADAFTMVPKVLTREKNEHLVRSTAQIVQSVDTYLVADDLRPNYARFVRKLYGKRAARLGWKSKKGESDDTRMLRPTLVSLVAVHGEDKKLIKQATKLTKQWFEDPSSIDSDMIGTVLRIAARNGDRELYDRFYEAAKSTKDRKRRSHLLSAMSSFTDPKIVKFNLGLMLGDEFELRESIRFMQAPLSNPGTRELAYSFVKDNYDAIMDKLPSFYGKYIVFVAAAFCDADHADDAEAFFEPKMKKVMGGPAALEQALEQVNICTAQRKAQQPSVSKFLKRY